MTGPRRELVTGPGSERRSVRWMRVIGFVAAAAVATPLVIAACSPKPAKLIKAAAPAPIAVLPAPAPGPSAAQLAKFRWSALPPSPLGAREYPVLAAAGHYLIELDGLRDGQVTETGAALDLSTRRWHPIAPMPGDAGFDQAVTVWTGRELFVADGGPSESCGPLPPTPDNCDPHVGLYDPAANRWSVPPLPGAMNGLEPVAAAWTGRVVVLAALDARRRHLAVAAYDPSTKRWQVITPRLPAEHSPAGVQLVATASRVILWSQWLPPVGSQAGVDVFAFADDRPNPVEPWRNVTGDWPQDRAVGPPVYTGHAILFPPHGQWCDICSNVYQVFQGFFTSLVTLHRTGWVPSGPLREDGSTFVWTGRTIIAGTYGRGNPAPFKLTNLTDYDPVTRTWRSLSAAPRDEPTDTVPVWTGSELVAVTEAGKTLALHR